MIAVRRIQEHCGAHAIPGPFRGGWRQAFSPTFRHEDRECCKDGQSVPQARPKRAPPVGPNTKARRERSGERANTETVRCGQDNQV